MAHDGVGLQMCYRRVCGSTPGDWGSNNPVLALSLRRCRTTAYTSSAVPRFTNMLLSPRPFGSRSVVRLGVISPELRPPLVAIPSVRDTAHPFSASGGPIWLSCLIFAASTLSDVLTAYCCPKLFRSAQMSRSPPPVSGFPGRPGRTLPRRVLWTRSPCKTHWRPVRLSLPGSACSFQRCSPSTFSVSLRCLSVFLKTCEQAREAYPVG